MWSRRQFLISGAGATAVAASAWKAAAQVISPSATLRIDRTRTIGRLPSGFSINLEDLNYQVYGGLYSQMLYGENFQEYIDSHALGVSEREHLQTFIETDRNGQVQVWGWDGRGWKHNLARKFLGLPLAADSQPIELIELSASQRATLEAAAQPTRQVVRHWRAYRQGTARGSYGIDTAAPFKGKRSQRVAFETGQGEAGIDNAGLNRWGLAFEAGRPYEGILRVRSMRPATIHVSIVGDDGATVLAHQEILLSANDTYQKVSFHLVPSASAASGRFRIGLRKPGEITLGFALLQPGEWARYQGLPVRADLANAMLGQGVTMVRYNGAMVNQCPEPQLYKWKEMIGPPEERKPYRGTFNPYATHSFGVFEFLALAEKAGFTPVVGLRADETPHDLLDFMEYLQGPVASTWGCRRAKDGHPEKYRLQHIEIGNEEVLDDLYCDRFEAAARAIWSIDPKVILLIATSIRSRSGEDIFRVGSNGEKTSELRHAIRLFEFARKQGGTVWLDTHMLANRTHFGSTNNTLSMMPSLSDSIGQAIPGYQLTYAVLEENGSAHNLERALYHTCNTHALARQGTLIAIQGVANTFQAWDQQMLYSQGNTFYDPTRIWFQPGYYVDQARNRSKCMNIVDVQLSGAHQELDVLARASDDGKKLFVEVVNSSSTAVSADIGWAPLIKPCKDVAVWELSGEPSWENSLEEPHRIAPLLFQWPASETGGRYTFPPSSVTMLTIE